MKSRAAALTALAIAVWPMALPAADQAPAVRAALAAAGQPDLHFTLPARPLPGCDGNLTAAPHQGGWAEAEIACTTPLWRRIIRTTDGAAPAPGRKAATAETRKALVTTHPVAKGSVIGADDLQLADVPASAAADSFADPAAAIGRIARQALSAGQPLLARQLQPDYAVHADQPATLQLQSGRVAVSVTVTPLEDGEQGQIIRLRHPVSGRELRARVAGQDFLILEANTP